MNQEHKRTQKVDATVAGDAPAVAVPEDASVGLRALGQHLRDVGGHYGAPMGRSNGVNRTPEGPVSVFRVTLDRGGYDEGGAYWGTPDNLFCAEDGEGFREFWRADSKADAQAKVREKYPEVVFEQAFDCPAFTEAYLKCAAWADLEEEYRHDLDESDFSDEAKAKAEKDCMEFITKNLKDLSGLDESQCGHDFWLTRNHEGTGFWDRGYGELGKKLTKAAHAEGGCDLYVGDDKKIYFM